MGWHVYNFKLDAPRVDSYETALACFEHCRDRKRDRSLKTYPLGHARSKISDITIWWDESIRFRFYRTDVVIWHKDNSVTVEGYSSQATPQFARCFLPGGITLNSDTTLLCFPKERPSTSSDYRPHWRDYWNNALICNADHPVTLREHEIGWLPDEAGIRPFTFAELDHKISRRISKELHLTDFERWLSMAPNHMNLYHKRVDMDRVARMLTYRNFKEAALHLPLIEENNRYGMQLVPLRIETSFANRKVTMSSLRRFRDWAYVQAGALVETKFKTLTYREYQNREKRRKALQKALGYR